MIKKKSKKGFTLVELIVVVAIIGVLSVTSIVAYTKYIRKAKEEKYANNEVILVEAAKAYYSSNSNLKPKNIGESTKVTAIDLKNNNYITSDLSNVEGESCMDNSYVYIHKYDQNKYAYKGFIYCGSETAPETVDVPTPTITKVKFSNMEEVDKASFSMTIKGSNDKKVELDSYLFTISVNNSDGNGMNEVYNSGSKLAQGNKTIEFNDMKLKKYIDITNVSNIVVTVSVKNILGGVTEERFNYTFKDTTKPQCEETTGEAVDDSDWLSKKDITELKKQRTITVRCTDGYGAGCIRDSFTSTWPKSDLESLRTSTITIKDNAKNTRACNVKVNVDVDAPTIKLEARNNSGQKTIENIEVKNWNNVTVNANAYKDNVNSWLNKAKYNGVVSYSASLTDNFYLYKYKWETNTPMYGVGTSTRVLKSNLNGPETKEETFNVVNGTSRNITFNFNQEGMRYGKLTVYDRAGNEAIIEIYANIDKTPPDKPQISFNKYRSTTYPSFGDSYTPGVNNWSNLSIISRIANQKTDSSRQLSGWAKFVYQYKDSSSYTTETDGERFDITNEGRHSIKYKSCDRAGNCSEYTNVDNINIDKTKPECIIGGESTTWQSSPRTIACKCEDKKNLSGCAVGPVVEEKVFNTTTKTATIKYNIRDKAGNKESCEKKANIYVDTTSPKVTLATAEDGYKLTGTVNDAHSGIGKYKWGSNSYSDEDENVNKKNYVKYYAANSSGTKIKFCAKDNVGNEGCSKEVTAYYYCKKVIGTGAKEGNPYGTAKEQSKFTTAKNTISAKNASTTVFNHVAFHWKYNKHHCKKDKTSSVENRAYFTLKEVGCVCGVDKHVNSHYCSNKSYDVGSKTHNKIGTSGEAFIAYEEDYCASVKVDAVINKNVKQVCNNGTKFDKSGVMGFHGYTFYHGDPPSDMKLVIPSEGVWTYNNHQYDGDLSNSNMCEKVCKKQ